MITEEQLYKEARELFLNERTKQEILVKEWGLKLRKVDPRILQGINIPEKLTLEELMPELYAEEPDARKYQSQFDECQKMFDAINEIASKYNEEAHACLLEYKELASRGQ